MKIINPCSEDEMILVFLKSELNSKRFKKDLFKAIKKLKISKKIILSADLKDKDENLIRKKLLGEYRGYDKNKDLFEHFPKKVKWFWAAISKKELKTVRYLNHSYWNEMSNHTRNPEIAAKNIKNGKKVYNVSNSQYFDALKKVNKFLPLILVSSKKNSRIVVLEGNLRLTSYFLSKKIPNKLNTIIGFSKALNNWPEY